MKARSNHETLEIRSTLTKLGSCEDTRLWNSSWLRVLEEPSFPAKVWNWDTSVQMAASMVLRRKLGKKKTNKKKTCE